MQAPRPPAAANAFRLGGFLAKFGSLLNIIGAIVITVRSFSPADQLERTTWEFLDDHLILRSRSLTLDFEREVPYKKIRVIRSRRMADLGWIWVSFLTAGSIGLAELVLNLVHTNVPQLDAIEKMVVVLAVVFFGLGFRKHEYYAFQDEHRNFLASIKVDRRTKPSLLKAITRIKRKAKITSEAYFDGPLPNGRPAYELTEFNFPDFLNRSRIWFYGDRLVAVDKSIAEEATRVVRYADLSGKTTVVQAGNADWTVAWSYWLFLVCVAGISAMILFPAFMRGNPLYLYMIYGAIALIAPMHAMSYLKRGLWLLFDRQDKVVFAAEINATNRAKLKQIDEFIRSKTKRRK